MPLTPAHFLLLACTGDKDPSDPSVTLAPLTTSLCAPSPLIGTADPAGPSTGSLSLDGTQYDIDLLLGIDGALGGDAQLEARERHATVASHRPDVARFCDALRRDL